MSDLAIPSLEDQSVRKFGSRRFILALAALAGLHVITIVSIMVNSAAADAPFLQAYAFALGGVLTAYYTAGYGDRRLAKQIVVETQNQFVGDER